MCQGLTQNLKTKQHRPVIEKFRELQELDTDSPFLIGLWTKNSLCGYTAFFKFFSTAAKT